MKPASTTLASENFLTEIFVVLHLKQVHQMGLTVL